MSDDDPRVRLHDALVRVDAATRARVLVARGDAEHVMVRAVARVEARAIDIVREGLRSHAWLVVGVTLAAGIFLGSLQRTTTNEQRRRIT
jgi:hypothetical protein